MDALTINRYYYSKYYTGRFLRPKREISTIYFLMFLELSVIQYRILNPLRCGKMPTSAL